MPVLQPRHQSCNHGIGQLGDEKSGGNDHLITLNEVIIGILKNTNSLIVRVICNVGLTVCALARPLFKFQGGERRMQSLVPFPSVPSQFPSLLHTPPPRSAPSSFPRQSLIFSIACSLPPSLSLFYAPDQYVIAQQAPTKLLIA